MAFNVSNIKDLSPSTFSFNFELPQTSSFTPVSVLYQNHFCHCKIQVKGKGEVEMYFVDSLISI